MIFILDCSVTMPWLLKNDSSGYSLDALRSFEKNQALVPELWSYEVGNVLAVAERKRKIKSPEALKFIQQLRELPIQVDDQETDILYQVYPLAREFQLSCYDAAYLELAFRLSLPLATLDQSLRKAAKKANVKLF